MGFGVPIHRMRKEEAYHPDLRSSTPLDCVHHISTYGSAVKCPLYCAIATATGRMFESEERQLFFYDFKLNVQSMQSPRRVHIDSIETPWGASSQTPPIVHVESMWSLYGVRK